MKFTSVEAASVERYEFIAQSDQFALYAMGDQTYLMVQRHEGQQWTGLEISGDGVFRIATLFAQGTRHMYRSLAARLSPVNADTLPVNAHTDPASARASRPSEPGIPEVAEAASWDPATSL